METEDQICRRYEAELTAIGALDHCYYVTPSATLEDRTVYTLRQVQLEETRSRSYAEFAELRLHGFSQVRRCRSVIRRSRFSTSSVRDQVP